MRRRPARGYGRSMEAELRSWIDDGSDVTVRRARPDDAWALERLAVLSSARPLEGEVLVAEVRGELWAAVSLSGGEMISDPFRATLVVRELLALRRRNLATARILPGRRLARLRLRTR